MKKPKAPKLVTVAITTTITIIFWIFFTLYQVLTTKPSPSVDPNLLKPIDANLNSESLEKVKDRIFHEEGSFVPLPTNAPITGEPTPSPNTIEISVTTTPSPEVP